MAIIVDTDVLALADQLIAEFDLISIRRPQHGGEVGRADLRIMMGAKIRGYVASQIAKVQVNQRERSTANVERVLDRLREINPHRTQE